MSLSRRAFCQVAIVGGAGLLLEGCASSDGASSLCEALPDDRTGWVEIPLEEHPELRSQGGSAAVRRPEALLDVVVIHQSEGCFAAVWRDCTHGACRVEYDPERRLLECPCHGSLFGEDGQVRRGPATIPLRSFPVVRDGDRLWVYRPV